MLFFRQPTHPKLIERLFVLHKQWKQLSRSTSRQLLKIYLISQVESSLSDQNDLTKLLTKYDLNLRTSLKAKTLLRWQDIIKYIISYHLLCFQIFVSAIARAQGQYGRGGMGDKETKSADPAIRQRSLLTNTFIADGDGKNQQMPTISGSLRFKSVWRSV